MRVILTSFRDAANHTGEKFSIARWQPRGFHIPELRCLAPLDSHNIPIYHLPSDEYRRRYESEVLSSDAAFAQIASNLLSYKDLVLCCWCNPDRQKGYAKLMCHRVLVGYFIEKRLPMVEVVYKDGAENPIWERL